MMITNGLYENSGQWLYRTGLPAKSRVGGGILAMVAGKYAVATFSPPLDGAGNSVRGQKAVQFIAEALRANRMGCLFDLFKPFEVDLLVIDDPYRFRYRMHFFSAITVLCRHPG